MLSLGSAGKIARSDSIPAGFACLKMIAAAFAQLETARLAKKLKAGGQLAGSKKGKRGAGKKGVSGGAIVGPLDNSDALP